MFRFIIDFDDAILNLTVFKSFFIWKSYI